MKANPGNPPFQIKRTTRAGVMSGWSCDCRCYSRTLKSSAACCLKCSPQETQEFVLNELQWDEQSHHLRLAECSVSNSRCCYRAPLKRSLRNTRKSAGNTGMAPCARDGGFSSLDSKAKRSRWNPSVCLTIRAFNHITSISASSHTDLNAFMLWKPTWKNYLSCKSGSGVEMDKQSFTKTLCII